MEAKRSEACHSSSECSLETQDGVSHGQDDIKDSSTNMLSDGNTKLPQMSIMEEMVERHSLSGEERLLAFVDVYGRNDREIDRHLEDFDREVRRLPIEHVAALHQGYTVKQARLFLQIEDYNPKRAAERMARYWMKRFEKMGDDAFQLEHMPDRTLEDFRRVYEMALKARMDPEVDDETRHWAERFSREWERGHLSCLDEEVAMIPIHEKAALVEAQKTRPDIAASDEHKLLFLRTEDFVAQRASRRMVNYWNLKFELFGREDAFRAVTVNDLMRNHARELSVGFIWNVRGTDTFGRSLMYFVPGMVFASLANDQGCTEEGLLKVIWYMFHAVLEEEKSSHDKGIVLLADERNTIFSFFKPKFAPRLNSLFLETLPVKIKALHVFPPPALWFFKIFLPFGKWIMGKRLRMRLWVHTGTEEKWLSDLDMCGISRDLIPTILGGNVDVDLLGRAWLEERRAAGL